MAWRAQARLADRRGLPAADRSLPTLAAAAETCRGCPLWEAARAGFVSDLRVAAAALAG